MSPHLTQHSPRGGRARRFLAGGLALALSVGVLAASVIPASGATVATPTAPRASVGTIYEAENQTRSGVTVQTEHAGYSGTGYVGGFGQAGNAVRADVTAAAAGSHDLFVRYANGNGGAGRTLTLDVNGTAREITLPGTGSWQTWGIVWAQVDLLAGANVVELRRTATDTGGLNLDYLRLAPQVGVRYEAENAALSGGAAVQTDHAGFTGTGFVGGLDTSGATASFTLNATETGNHPATLRYGAGPNPFNGPKKVTLAINGVPQSIILPGFSSWKDWGDFTLDLPLNAGSNQLAIRFAPGDDGNVNLDHLDVGQPAPPVCDPVIAPDDTFAGTMLDRCRWTTILNQDDTGYRVADGALQIDAKSGDLSGGVTNAKNVILQPAPSGSWMTETSVSLDGADDYLQAGLVVWGNAANFGKVMVIRTPAAGWKVELGRVTDNTLQYTGSASLTDGAQTDVRLRLWSDDGVLRGSYSLDDGATYTVVGDGYSTTGLANPLVGVGAFNGTGAETARFDEFQVGAPVRVESTVTVQADPTSVQIGASSTVTVQVAAPGATPTGEVTLRDNDEIVGTATLTNGTATFTVGPHTAAGTRTLTASYAGDTAVAAGTGTSTLTVDPAPQPVPSTVTVTANPGTVQVGDRTQVTVTVTAVGTTPTGDVTLSDGDRQWGGTLVDGVVTIPAGPWSAAGDRTLTASYTGDAQVSAGSGTRRLVVRARPRAAVQVGPKVVDATRDRRNGVVAITCRPTGVRCEGIVKLWSNGRLLGRGVVDLASGRKANVRITLTARARQLLGKRPRVSTKLVVALDGGDRTTATVTLRR